MKLRTLPLISFDLESESRSKWRVSVARLVRMPLAGLRLILLHHAHALHHHPHSLHHDAHGLHHRAHALA